MDSKNLEHKNANKESKPKFTLQILGEWDSMHTAYLKLKNGGRIVKKVVNRKVCKFVE